MIKMYIVLHIKYPLLLSDLNETSIIFSKDFRKILKISNFMKIIPLGAQFHAERQTDRQTDGWTDRRTNKYDEASNGFSQFCERA